MSKPSKRSPERKMQIGLSVLRGELSAVATVSRVIVSCSGLGLSLM